LEIKKSQTKSGFSWLFHSRKRLALEKLSELHINYKSLLKRAYNHAGCTKYRKDFTVAIKMINFFDKKQMYDSVITGKVQ